jgi:hypothetical protein
MKIWKIICILFLFCHNLMGQTGTICFNIIDSKTKTQVSEVRVFIMDSLGTEILSTTIVDSSECCLSGMPTGRFNIELHHFNHQTVRIENVRLNVSGDTAVIKCALPPKAIDCESDTTKALCPYCKSIRKVLPIKPGLIVHYNFAHEKDIKRYDSKLARQKYELYNDSGQVVVIGVWLPNEKEKFWDFQHCWFCQKCKKVF